MPEQLGDDLEQYASALGLPAISSAQLKSQLDDDSVDEESVNLGWFFESTELNDWKSSPSTAILQLGGKSRPENHRVFERLSSELLEEGSKVVLVSCSPSLGFLHKAKSEEQMLWVLQLLIRQLMNDNISRIRYAMSQYPLSELQKASLYTTKDEKMLRHLHQVLFHSLSAEPGRVYLLLDGIDALGRAMYRIVHELAQLHSKLMEPDQTYKPVVKLFFDTPPRSLSGLWKDLGGLLDQIAYIEKDKELKG
jgi:hypothetical protein